MKFNLEIERDDAIIVYRILMQHAVELELSQARVEADDCPHVEICRRAGGLLGVAASIREQLAEQKLV